MNDILSKHEMRTLMVDTHPVSISLYLPTHRISSESQADSIRLKNLLSDAESRLLEAGMRRPEVESLLQPAAAKVDDHYFWQQQSDGLAIFLAEEKAHFYRLPIRFEELLVIGPRWQVKPLLPIYNHRSGYYLLALSQNAVRFFHGTPYTIGEIALDTIPHSLAEAQRFDDPERQLQYHSKTGRESGGERAAIFHGHGDDYDKDQILLHYFRRIDDGLQKFLRQEESPLLLAGVDYLLPIYRKANSYEHLVDAALEGNPEHLSAAQLREKAQELLAPYLIQAERDARRRYAQLCQTEQASADLNEILMAAHHGKVEFLFVATDEQCWGQFDPTDGTVHRHDALNHENEDLLNLAAVQTILHDGQVFVGNKEELPEDETAIAAVYRY